MEGFSMAVEPMTEPIVLADPAAPSEPARSRRSILGAGLAGLAGLVLGSLGRPAQARADSGDPLIMGAANSAGTSNTSLTTASSGTALLVTQTGSGTALRGSATAIGGIAGFFTSAHGPGVSGVTADNTQYGVYGANNAATHNSGAAMRAAGGQNHGLVATTAANSAFAIKATNTNNGTGASASGGIRVLAGNGTDAHIDNLAMEHGAGEFAGAFGVIAVAVAGGNGVFATGKTGDAISGTSDQGSGVSGTSNDWYGVVGQSTTWYGVAGYSTSSYGVYSSGPARVYGNLTVTGTLSKGGGSFKIDHPLDPANKFLYHSFVESPDMKNVYDGVVTLDAAGEATITLPDWFEALNRDTRIQLTAVGRAAPDLHVKSKVQGGVFSIGGGKAGQEVYWQLTGIRQDAWANANRIPVEEDKSADERGLYLHPAEHGQPAAHGIDAVRDAAMRSRVSK
jgi:hypothetical protein